MKNKKISDVIDTVVQVINRDRPDEKMICMSDSTQLLGGKSVLDSLDLFMFIIEFEAQLRLAGEDIDVMGIIECAISENNEISLRNLVTKIEQL